MSSNDPTIWQQALVMLSSIGTWLTGEIGRTMIAGGAGGFYRWFMSEKRKLRDGAVSVIAGMISAVYFSPIVLAGIEKMIGDLGDSVGVQNTSAFCAGLVGMSVSKIVIAGLENQADKMTGGSNDKN